MAAKMYRGRSIFEKLAPLWALLMMGLHMAVYWYMQCITKNAELRFDYTTHIKYFVWIAVVAVSTWSFAPADVAAIVRHTLFYLVSAAVWIAGLYWYVMNIYINEKPEDLLELFTSLYGQSREEVCREIVRGGIEYSILLCGAVAAFCVVKYRLSASGWINKRIK